MTSFAEVRAELKRLSAYGDDLAGKREDWDYDPAQNVWKRKDVQASGARLKNVILFGEGTVIDPTARVTNAIIGPHTKILDHTQVDQTRICGYDWDNAPISQFNRALNWPPRESVIRNSTLRNAGEIKASLLNFAVSENAAGIFASQIDLGEVSGPGSKASWSALYDGARVMNGAQAVNSILESHALLADPGTVADSCTLREESQMRHGRHATGCVLEKGVVLASQDNAWDQFIDSTRPAALLRHGAMALAGRPFTRSTAQNAALVAAEQEREAFVLPIAA